MAFIKKFQMATCKCCSLAFQPVSWLPWRTGGYCSLKCVHLAHDGRS